MIWIIGNKGMLGSELEILLQKENMEFIGTDLEVDITDKESLSNFTKGKNISCIVNCAAYTAVDKAEDDMEKCRLINTFAVKNITEIAGEINAFLIHISTDYVFNGKGKKPYKEDDPTDPIGVYGLTKRDGEEEALKYAKSCIVRTAWLYGIYGNNFVKTMIKLMNEKQELKVVNDQIGSPTWTRDLAGVIIKIINNPIYGIYHFTNEGEISWCDFAKEIYKLAREKGIVNNECSVLPCTSAEFPAKVTRPAFSVLDKTKIKSTLGIDIKCWKESLNNYLEIKGI